MQPLRYKRQRANWPLVYERRRSGSLPDKRGTQAGFRSGAQRDFFFWAGGGGGGGGSLEDGHGHMSREALREAGDSEKMLSRRQNVVGLF